MKFLLSFFALLSLSSQAFALEACKLKNSKYLLGGKKVVIENVLATKRDTRTAQDDREYKDPTLLVQRLKEVDDQDCVVNWSDARASVDYLLTDEEGDIAGKKALIYGMIDQHIQQKRGGAADHKGVSLADVQARIEKLRDPIYDSSDARARAVDEIIKMMKQLKS